MRKCLIVVCSHAGRIGSQHEHVQTVHGPQILGREEGLVVIAHVHVRLKADGLIVQGHHRVPARNSRADQNFCGFTEREPEDRIASIRIGVATDDQSIILGVHRVRGAGQLEDLVADVTDVIS